MTAQQQNLIKRFLNIFTLMHFSYFTEAEKELNDVIDINDTNNDITHAKPIAKLVLNWVADAKQEQQDV